MTRKPLPGRLTGLYAVCSPGGFIAVDTIRYNRSAPRAIFGEFSAYTWKQLYRKGYRVIPVTISTAAGSGKKGQR